MRQRGTALPPVPPVISPRRDAGGPPQVISPRRGASNNRGSLRRGRGVPPTPNTRGAPPQRIQRGGTTRPPGRPTSQIPKMFSTPGSVLKSGFLAKQQSRGEQPNAKKFFQHISLSVLQSGLKMSPEALEMFDTTTKSHLESTRSSQLLTQTETKFLLQTIHKIQHFLAEQKNLQNILTIQSCIRRWQVQRRFKSLKDKNERKRILQRNQKFLELLGTEKKFVNSLHTLINKFVIPLRHSDIIEPQEGAYLFCNIETIVDDHKKLCKRIQEAQQDWPFLGNVGKIFLDIKGLLNATSVYVGHFKTAINEIERLKIEKPRFKQFLEQVQCDFDLPMLLLLPVNRISQYEFYLKNMADFMIPGTTEREDCDNASAALAQSSLVVQSSLVESGNVANILKVQQKLRSDKGPLTVMMPGRIFIHECMFKKFYVCVFSDIILVASRATKAKELHKHKASLPINKTELVSDNKILELKSENQTFKLSPLSPESKQDFIRCYNRAVEEINRIKVFGVPLIETIIREERSDGIPFIIDTLSKFILENGSDCAGIFRVAGSTAEINSLKEAFDAGEQNPQILKLKEKNLFSVCDVLKLYFRSLPEPMLSFNLYNPIVEIMRDTAMDDDARVKKIQDALLNWTPPFALKVLSFLMKFLNEISKHSEENKMTTNNIAIVFGPTLLWAEHNTLEAAMDMPYINGAVKVIIDNYVSILS